MVERWRIYQKDFEYAREIDFNDACDAIHHMMRLCIEN